jgi:anti-sigma factor RsiW
MDHIEAIRTRAAERYVLKQLNAKETEEFEEHYFSCVECAEEVRWVTMFESNAKKAIGKKVRETSAEFVTLARLVPGDGNVVTLPEQTRHLILSIALPEAKWRAKHVSLATGAGTARFTMAVPADQIAAGAIHVMVEAREMDPGRHTLTVISDDEDHLEFHFNVQLLVPSA